MGFQNMYLCVNSPPFIPSSTSNLSLNVTSSSFHDHSRCVSKSLKDVFRVPKWFDCWTPSKARAMKLHQCHRFDESWPTISLLVRECHANYPRKTWEQYDWILISDVKGFLGENFGAPTVVASVFNKLISEVFGGLAGTSVKGSLVRSGTHSWTLAAPPLIEFKEKLFKHHILTSCCNGAINFPLFFLHDLLSFRFFKMNH